MKVFTTLPIPAVAFKETTNSPSPPFILQIISWEDSLNSPNRTGTRSWLDVTHSNSTIITVYKLRQKGNKKKVISEIVDGRNIEAMRRKKRFGTRIQRINITM